MMTLDDELDDFLAKMTFFMAKMTFFMSMMTFDGYDNKTPAGHRVGGFLRDGKTEL